MSKSERVELVTSPRITVYNSARGNLSVLNQVAYVQDFNVEIAQGASIADPIVNVVQDGVVLDVRPVVSAYFATYFLRFHTAFGGLLQSAVHRLNLSAGPAGFPATGLLASPKSATPSPCSPAAPSAAWPTANHSAHA